MYYALYVSKHYIVFLWGDHLIRYFNRLFVLEKMGRTTIDVYLGRQPNATEKLLLNKSSLLSEHHICYYRLLQYIYHNTLRHPAWEAYPHVTFEHTKKTSTAHRKPFFERYIVYVPTCFLSKFFDHSCAS